MAQAERGRAAGCAARVRRCTALLTCLGRPCVLTLGLSQLDPIPPCLSDVSRVEHRGTESVSVRVSLSNRALSLHPRVELNANGQTYSFLKLYFPPPFNYISSFSRSWGRARSPCQVRARARCAPPCSPPPPRARLARVRALIKG